MVLLRNSLKSVCIASFWLLISLIPVVHAVPDAASAPSDVVIVEKNAQPEHNQRPANAVVASALAQEIILHAMHLIGVRYQWGGNQPDFGLDCSGFIQYVFQQALKVALPRTARGMSQIGTVIARDKLQPGDLVFFNTLRRQFSHVGIYLGDDRFIHAPSTGKTITVADMKQKYWLKRYNGARRLHHDMVAEQTDLMTTTIEEEALVASTATSRVQKKTPRKKALQKKSPAGKGKKTKRTASQRKKPSKTAVAKRKRRR